LLRAACRRGAEGSGHVLQWCGGAPSRRRRVMCQAMWERPWIVACVLAGGVRKGRLRCRQCGGAGWWLLGGCWAACSRGCIGDWGVSLLLTLVVGDSCAPSVRIRSCPPWGSADLGIRMCAFFRVIVRRAARFAASISTLQAARAAEWWGWMDDWPWGVSRLADEAGHCRCLAGCGGCLTGVSLKEGGYRVGRCTPRPDCG